MNGQFNTCKKYYLQALQKARQELGLVNDDVYVEVLEETKKGLFKKSYIKIRVYYGDEEKEDIEKAGESEYLPEEGKVLSAESDVERKTIDFVTTLIKKMGYDATITISSRRDSKISLNIESDSSSILIGRKGKNLDAIQLLANVYAAKLDEDAKVVIDSENYRARHEDLIVRDAIKNAEYVRRSGKSKLLEPMNPFERRIIHLTLAEWEDIETISEGEGLYKKVRVIYKKNFNA